MQRRLADYRLFWQEFRQTFTSTGAVLPSGAALAKALAHYVDPAVDPQNGQSQRGEQLKPQAAGPRRILEVGPGTGPVTSQILRRMGPEDTLDLVELNDRFVDALEKRLRDDPQWQPLADRVRMHHLPIEQIMPDAPFDVLISGLPLNNFPCTLVEAVFAKFHQLAAPGAMLSFFQYVAVRKVKSLFCRKGERQRLAGIERILDHQFTSWEVESRCIMANVPPAWVHHLRMPGIINLGQRPRY